MKNLILFIAVQLCTIHSYSQINPGSPWTWVKGDNTINQRGIYGSQGIPASANKPGARNFSTTWKDAAGNLWLFGGSGYATVGVGYLNDLWKYDPLIHKWTWINGDSSTGQYAIYGTPGIADAVNKPGAAFASISWTDAENNLWLFGGFGFSNNSFGFLNSIWKYNISTNEWTWVKGDTTVDEPAVYGVQGIESSTNKPGARYGSQAWTDATGNLWMFGGYGYDTSSSGILNDIWKYSPSTNQWTWIKGDPSVEQVAVYGTKGIPGASNKPGARYVSSSWTDQAGKLWVFGGYGYDENNCGDLNDLWKYDPSTNEWTWIHGDNVIDQPGDYGEKGVPCSTNKPGARYVSNSWEDAYGEIWMFGGYGHDASQRGYLNDLWKYNPPDNTWTWIKGDNTVDQFGVYGTQGIPDTSNKSGSRTGSVSWADGLGNLWLFGGYGYDGSSSGVLNDLWKLNSQQSVLPLRLLRFTGVLNNEKVSLQWETAEEIHFSHFNIQLSFDGIQFTNSGIIPGTGNSNRNNYSWVDADIWNRPWQKVFYRLQLMNNDGRFTYSKVILFNRASNSTALTIFPNPAVNSLNLSFVQNKTGIVTLSVIDIKGVIVKKQMEPVPAGTVSLNMDVSNLPAAAYIVSVTNGEFAWQQKFIKQ